MKKFKLIKTYPGSPELGAEVDFTGFKQLTQQAIEYPEFWEQVVEKDYEILSYIKKGSISCTTTRRRGGERHEEFWEILSVKRLSDGEVFKIGDSFDAGIGTRTIRSFEIDSDGILVIKHEHGCITSGVEGTFKEAKKNSPPIFLTHDGKDIFAGDIVWYVNKQSLYCSYLKSAVGVKFFSDINVYFLTNELAQDYVNKNTVLFTTEDGVGVRKGDTAYIVDDNFKLLPDTYFDIQSDGRLSFRKYFSTREAAERYILRNTPAISIEEFWKITAMSGSNRAKSIVLEELVKIRL